MDKDRLIEMLGKVKDGSMPIEDAVQSLRTLPYEDLGFAKIDNHRQLRRGYPEVVFCQGKTIPQIQKIVERLSENHASIIATKATSDVYKAVSSIRADIEYNEPAQMLLVGKPVAIKNNDTIMVLTAGTSDIPIAEEAAATAAFMGNKVERMFDVGVAGIHRLFGNMDRILNASVIVVAAGMDGALPSIIGGIASCPIIAVPTSIGYGANFGGLAPLLTMLNSCAPGVTVVNINNGFGAGYSASMINHKGGNKQ